MVLTDYFCLFMFNCNVNKYKKTIKHYHYYAARIIKVRKLNDIER